MLSALKENCNLADKIRYNVKKVNAGNAIELTAKFWPFMIRDHKDTPIVHHILSCPPSEQLTKEKWIQILECLMEGNGLADFPYVAYLHNDTAAPHVHQLICSYSVYGNKLDFQQLRKGVKKQNRLLEKEFDLTRMQPNPRPEVYKRPDLQQRPLRVSEMSHGQKMNPDAASKKVIIDRATKQVIDNYQFGSIDEFNALLSLYGVKGVLSKKGKIYYVVLDDKGKPDGMYISAWQLKGTPNMRLLNWKMDLYNEDPHKSEAARHIRAQVNLALTQQVNSSLEAFLDTCLEKELFLHWSVRKGELIPEITYIDQLNKRAFHQDSIGEAYEGKAILDTFHVAATDLAKSLDKLKAPRRGQGPAQDPGQWNLGLRMY